MSDKARGARDFGRPQNDEVRDRARQILVEDLQQRNAELQKPVVETKPAEEHPVLGAIGGIAVGFGTRAMISKAQPWLATYGTPGKVAAIAIPFVAAGLTSDYITDQKLGNVGQMAIGAGAYGTTLGLWKFTKIMCSPCADSGPFLTAGTTSSAKPYGSDLLDPTNPLSPFNPMHPGNMSSPLNPLSPISIFKPF